MTQAVGRANLSFGVTGLNCAGCAGRAERALTAAPGVISASVNIASKQAVVDPGAASLADLTAALQQAGYPAAEGVSELKLEGMSCASCVGRLEHVFLSQPGVIEAQVNLAEGTARIRHLVGPVTPQDLVQAATGAGYPAQLLTDPAADLAQARVVEGLRERRNLLLALVLALPLFLMEMGGHIYPPLHHTLMRLLGQQEMLLLQFILCTLLLVGPGRQFFSRGVPALLRGAPDMNSLVATGTFAAWAYSTLAVFLPGVFPAGSAQVYFEAAGVVTALVLLGRWLEARAKGRTGAAIRALMDLQPPEAEVIAADGSTSFLPLGEVKSGMALRLRPGAKVPVDGVVIHGESHVDESMMTGEPLPVLKSSGAPLTAGCVNGAGVLDMRAEAVGAETRLAQIISMVRAAQGAKLPVQALVDRVTLWFVPAVMALAALTALVWLVLGPDLAHALVAAVCVLIIACPCAMGLATPTSVMVALGRAAQLGVLFRRGDALQRLGEVDCLVFDKTGTLTEGRPSLGEVTVQPGFDKDRLLAQVASLEARSEHPLARAFEAVRSDLHVGDMQVIAGQGLRGCVDGQDLHVGSVRLLQDAGIDCQPVAAQALDWAGQGAGVIHVACDGELAALIAVRDPIRTEAKAALAQLRHEGLRLVMLTGDAHSTAQSVARELGIDEIHAECLPEDKHAKIKALKAEGLTLGFVGDGINDAPALASADVGIAIGAGTDVAIEAADVVLSQGGLRALPLARQISRAAMRNIRQNLGWAFGYNVALLPVAAGVLVPFGGPLLSPTLGGAAMALSSVFVVSNALRLTRFAPT